MEVNARHIFRELFQQIHVIVWGTHVGNACTGILTDLNMMKQAIWHKNVEATPGGNFITLIGR